MKLKPIYSLILFVLNILTLTAYSNGIRQYEDGLLSWSDQTLSRIEGREVKVDYSTKIWDNEVSGCPTIALIDQLTNVIEPTSDKAVGWDRIIKKDIILLASAFNTQTSYTTVDITLAQDDKDHLIVGSRLRFDFTPSSTTYTNVAVVTDKKLTSDRTTITITASDGASYIGTSGTTAIPAATKIMILPPAFADGAATVAGIQQNPSEIYEEYQDIRYPWNMTDKMELVALNHEGTPESILLDQHAGEFARMREMGFFFNPASWYYPTSISHTMTATTVNSSYGGFLHKLLAGTSPANYPYASANVDAIDTWTDLLDDSALDDIAKNRFTVCTSGFQTMLSKLKRDKPGVELAPNDTWGIPGVTRYVWGGLTLDLHRHWLFDKWFGRNVPVAVALTLPMIEYRPLRRPYQRMNIPYGNGETAKRHEFRVQETFLVHQINTAYYGMFYPNTMSAI